MTKNLRECFAICGDAGLHPVGVEFRGKHFAAACVEGPVFSACTPRSCSLTAVFCAAAGAGWSAGLTATRRRAVATWAARSRSGSGSAPKANWSRFRPSRKPFGRWSRCGLRESRWGHRGGDDGGKGYQISHEGVAGVLRARMAD